MTDIDCLINIYEDYWLRNPNRGKPQSPKNYLDGKGNRNYIFPAWFTKEEFDYVLTTKEAKNYLSSLGLDIQNYYDIVVLGLRSPLDRPRCECGEPVKFKTFSIGYDKYCCFSHGSKYSMSQAFIEAGHKSKLGYETPQEVKDKISKSEKLSKAGKTYVCSPETSKKLSRAKKGKRKSLAWKKLMSNLVKQKIKTDPSSVFNNLRGRGKKSKYFSKKANKTITCLSSWEREFLRLCDEEIDYIVKVDTCDPIEYYDPVTKKNRLYIPDFLIYLDNGDSYMIEVKPTGELLDPTVLAKKYAAKKFCKNNKIKGYVMITELALYKRKDCYFNLFDYTI